jgi:hypothetical protein
LQVIRSSVRRLNQLQDAFIRQMHHDITTVVPDLAGGGWPLCQRMVQLMLWLAVTDQPPHVAADTLRQVGASNRLDGFPEGHYVSVAHAVVRAVRDLSGDDWSTSIGSAWISYFQWIKPHLVIGAQQAAAHEAAAQEAADRQAAGRRAAAQQAASQAHAVAGDVDLESVAPLLDDEDDDEDVGYRQIMTGMTRNPRRERPEDGTLPGDDLTSRQAPPRVPDPAGDRVVTLDGKSPALDIPPMFVRHHGAVRLTWPKVP